MTAGFPLRADGDRAQRPGSRPLPRGTLSAVLLLAFFSAAVPLLLVVDVPDIGRSLAWTLTIGVAVWAGARLSFAIVSGQARLFDFFFWLFAYIFMGLAPTVQIRSGLLSTTTPGMSPDLDVPAALVVCAGLLCYEAGRALAILRERSLRARQNGALPNERAGQRVLGVNRGRTLLLLAIGVVFSAYFVQRIGVGTLLSSRDTVFAARQAAWPDPAVRSVMYALAIYPLLIGIGALAVLRRGSDRSRGFPLAVLLGATALLLVVVNPVSSVRYSLGTVWFALVVYAGAMLTVRRRRTLLGAAIAGLIFVFPLADAFRRVTVDVSWDGFFGEYKSSPDYDAFWQIANALSFVHDGLVVPGRQALGTLFFWVPRALWADKPVDTGILLADYSGYPFANLSAPLWAEALVNGGLIVVVAAFAGLGALLRRFDTRLVPAFGQNGLWAIAGAIFPIYLLILLRGSLLQASGTVAVAIACLLFVAQRPERPDEARLRPSAGDLRLADRLPAARPRLAGRPSEAPGRSTPSRSARSRPAVPPRPSPGEAPDPPGGV
ncbi:biotin synthase [Leifsonia xyli subsp. cynodontis DSM 46306]|uniref:Oligosaccharide repeat unit polymerase n=1 Tax=Leifsonia xyli subsp. cynodontis DSM 46306 TaxID=1389489 RepID=U3PCE2_LEIXC|nr:biotin synthase [Leifsonia xyli subsp. cynodontis DSM 46306]